MRSEHLREHDANQGAQSSGEFLGMTGNSGWYLLGSAGASIMMVIVLWGILGISIILCLILGGLLCGLSLAYVFALKNNKPEHYASDFFEAALVEAGMLQFAFGARAKALSNPFDSDEEAPGMSHFAERVLAMRRPPTPTAKPAMQPGQTIAEIHELPASEDSAKAKVEETVTLKEYERLQEQLNSTESTLEEVLAEKEED
jgi:hypothetical protein